MRIGHISPFGEQVSVESQHPQGGMIVHLTEQFNRLGHDVTVFASGDSRTAGTVVPVAPFSMRSYPAPKRHLAEALAMLALEKAFAMVPPLVSLLTALVLAAVWATHALTRIDLTKGDYDA